MHQLHSFHLDLIVNYIFCEYFPLFYSYVFSISHKLSPRPFLQLIISRTPWVKNFNFLHDYPCMKLFEENRWYFSPLISFPLLSSPLVSFLPLSSPLLTPPPLIYHCQFSAHFVCSPMCPTNLFTTVLFCLVFFFSILLYSALFSYFLFT